MKRLLPLLALFALVAVVGCASRPIPDRITDAKAIYTGTFNALAVAQALHPFPPEEKKAIGSTLKAIEDQIDAADGSHRAGNDGNALFWITQAETALQSAGKLKGEK